jgi:hypothetical protein
MLDVRRSLFVSRPSSLVHLPSSFVFYFFSGWPSILAGRNKMDLISAKNASAAIPTTRNGIDKSHTIGHNTNANNAIGQHSASKIAHNSNVTNTLIAYLLKTILLQHFNPQKKITFSKSHCKVYMLPFYYDFILFPFFPTRKIPS